MKIARVFPRKTVATPDDELAFVGAPPKILLDIDVVHISVTFSYDVERAEQLAEVWHKVGIPVKIGGVAMGDKGGIFVPGRYLRKGYVITSRGCPNHCALCTVPAREGDLRELPITEGHNVCDSNILACSEKHIRGVFAMLKNQPERPIFTGGLEKKLLRSWHVVPCKV